MKVLSGWSMYSIKLYGKLLVGSIFGQVNLNLYCQARSCQLEPSQDDKDIKFVFKEKRKKNKKSVDFITRNYI